MEDDTFKTVSQATPAAVVYKERKSKFYGYAFPIETEMEVKPIIDSLRKQYPSANHVCYAWQLGVQDVQYKANDDGEPNNSAGMPIYGQIQSFGLTNVLVAVVRIFGGVKLGVGGLMAAYRTCAQQTLQESSVVIKTINKKLKLQFGYDQMQHVMKVVKKYDLTITSQTMDLTCRITLLVRASLYEKVYVTFNALPMVMVHKE